MAFIENVFWFKFKLKLSNCMIGDFFSLFDSVAKIIIKKNYDFYRIEWRRWSWIISHSNWFIYTQRVFFYKYTFVSLALIRCFILFYIFSSFVHSFTKRYGCSPFSLFTLCDLMCVLIFLENVLFHLRFKHEHRFGWTLIWI